MEEIISRLDILMKTVKILDGQKHVRTSTEEYSKTVDALNEAKNLLRMQQTELENAKEFIEIFQKKKECLDYLNQKTLAIKNYIRECPKPSPSPVRSPPSHSPVAISESSRDTFGSFYRNPMPIDVNQPFANSTVDSGRPNGNPPLNLPVTPKPRANLVTSVSYITNGEYATIPQYMKGRIKYEELNTFIDLFNEILNKKYSLLNKPRGQIRAQPQMDMIQNWNAQKTGGLEGQYFVGPNDFSDFKNHKLSKKDYSILVIMRHLKKIKEVKHKTSKLFSVLL